MSEAWMQILTIVGTNFILMITLFGVTISLHLGMREEIRDFHKEMRNMHGRVCGLEAKKKSK